MISREKNIPGKKREEKVNKCRDMSERNIWDIWQSTSDVHHAYARFLLTIYWIYNVYWEIKQEKLLEPILDCSWI